MESIEQTFNGSADWGRKVTCTISRNGDLIHRVYLQVTLPQVTVSGQQQFRWLNWLGHVMIRYVEVEIGGQRIDRQYGDWLHIWNELSQAPGKKDGYASMVGNVPRLVQPISGADNQDTSVKNTGADFAFGDCDTSACMPETVLFVPLEFWFCRNPGLALPLIALQYHEVKINLEFREASGVFWAYNRSSFTLPSLKAASLYVDYVYLDTDERRRFAQTSHEYLIEQLQYTGAESVNSTSNKIKLNFNHPVKELIWVVQPDSNVDINATAQLGGPQWFNYTDALDVTPYTGTPGSPYGEGLVGAGNPFNAGSMTQALFSNGDSATVIDQGFVTGIVANDINVTDTAGKVFVQNSILPDGWSVANAKNATLATAWNVGLSSGNFLLDRGNNPTAEAKLQLNGHDRFSARNGRYFNLVQPYQHHTNTPAIGINVYSFGLKPEEHQPSGTCNMSRIDNATLQLQLTTRAVTGARSCQVRVYATNYNVLRIMSGMGGLAYSN